MLELKYVPNDELASCLTYFEAYWQELMPHVDVIKDVARRDRYFQEQFVEGELELYVTLDGTKQVKIKNC